MHSKLLQSIKIESTHQVKCILLNPQSLNNKISILIQFLEDNSIDICLFTETWLKTQNNFVTASLKEAGYKITHCIRQNKNGGGLQ